MDDTVIAEYRGVILEIETDQLWIKLTDLNVIIGFSMKDLQISPLVPLFKFASVFYQIVQHLDSYRFQRIVCSYDLNAAERNIDLIRFWNSIDAKK